MPHIRAIFPEDPTVRTFLRRHKATLCGITAKHSGYDVAIIGLIPEPIAERDADISHNLLQLEFKIDAGKNVATEDEAERVSEAIAADIVEQCPNAKSLNFGVWYISHTVCGFTGHRPD